MQNSNPFSKIRAEQMGDSAWKYFVEPSQNHINEQPLIFEGSRGTGKTMFFRCNSWNEKYSEAKTKGVTFEAFLSQTKHIGFYYKADGRFVKSLEQKNISPLEWVGIFNTYFNVVICKEIIPFIKTLIEEELIPIPSFKKVIEHITFMIEEDNVDDIGDLKSTFERVILKIEKFSNNTEKPKPVGLNAGTVIEKLLLSLKEFEVLKNNTFHIFIDEFEVFSEQQQIEINTLLKQSDSNIVYDFGVITKGIQTYKTGSGQVLQQKDDFALLKTDGYGYYESTEYNSLLIEICKKRLKEELDKVKTGYDEKLLKIDYYLKSYDKNYEESLFTNKPADVEKLKNRIFTEVKKQAGLYNYSTDEYLSYYEVLVNTTIVKQRIHLALLSRRNQYSVPAKQLVNHFENNSREYKEWIHNTETAAVYLLCHEFKTEKKYHGFKVYSALSSGVIRSFLELAEYAFDYAFNSSPDLNFFDKPRPFTIDEQTKAVYFVSNFKLREIDSYEPNGLQLKRFTIALGKIFSALHTNSNSTLGEVEHNHFETKITDVQGDNGVTKKLLNDAIRHKILEEAESTKTKSNEVVEFTDYHLNHIYCPAFKISHLRKRKILILGLDLMKLFCGSHKDLEEVVKKLSGSSDDSNPSLFPEYT
ncbi:hypothetical protein ACFQ3S_10955 [Mucilaginibacter terrae]|uniref:ORC-CDC6 family AAA ATPase n=1 Tax=Mucilaginibacter terrae TaxID=1955052 RepID=UPI0036276507